MDLNSAHPALFIRRVSLSFVENQPDIPELVRFGCRSFTGNCCFPTSMHCAQ
jgi:hypothetical protein